MNRIVIALILVLSASYANAWQSCSTVCTGSVCTTSCYDSNG